jgi:glucose-1-phosphate thymidylyltransferase
MIVFWKLLPSYKPLKSAKGLRIACPEEIAHSTDFITRDQFLSLAKQFEKSSYGQYLLAFADE